MIRRVLDRFPSVKAVLRPIYRLFCPGETAVSNNYVRLEGEQVEREARRLRSAWQDNDIPRRQRALVETQLKDFRAGISVPVFDALVSALRSLPIAPGSSLLEVGCSSGYYAEVLEIGKIAVRYQGCDYSPSFVELARQYYPQHRFATMDATCLDYDSNQFDVVVSGCCILHIPEYAQAIAETARVAKQYAIFHRTPVVHRSPTQHFTKEAYGIETIELHFNEQELFSLFARESLRVIESIVLSEEPQGDDIHAVKTYVCQKTSP